MKKQKVPLVGIMLVVIGTGLLLRRLDIIHLTFGTILWGGIGIGGAVLVVRSYLSNVRKGIFFGSLCFYGGILFFLNENSIISHHPSVMIPALLAGFGFSFLSLYIFNPRDIHLLIPFIVFAGFGAALMLTELGYWYYEDMWNAVNRYWPLLIIFFGVWILFFRKRPA